MIKTKKKLGDILVATKKISHEQLDEALNHSRNKNLKLGEAISELGFLSDEELMNTLSLQLSIELVDLNSIYIDPEAARSIPKNVASKYCLIPYEVKDNYVFIALSDPLNVYAIADVEFITKKTVIPRLTNKTDINKAIDKYYNLQTTQKALADFKKEYDQIKIDEKIDIIEDIQNAPTVRLVNSIINQAVNMRASDIHIEPYEAEIRVRVRVDGVLDSLMSLPVNTYSAVSTRFKVMASMDIAEKRRPQDGRIEMEIKGRSFDFRVSSLPTVFGEKIVIRILDKTSFEFSRETLGFTEYENMVIDQFQIAPYGIVLVTGPTGSGKSTTLYTLLKEQNKPDRNIVTVEDPVEYMLNGINQVSVNNKAGLTFAAGLRSILRQDPDVIMIGEIRDEETAQIAIRSAITGHMVFSTLHTNDAPSSITRLIDMGVESYLLADSITGIIAQRLIRKLCEHCKEKYAANSRDKKTLGIEQDVELYKAVGCPTCHGTGFRGRTAIHEVLNVTKDIKAAIENKANSEIIKELAIKNGMSTLYMNCRELVLKGVTTINEMVKTVYARD